MTKLFLDIETIPAPESFKDELAKEIQPENLDPENIQKWEERIEKKYLNTSLNGDLGRILCIAYIKEIPIEVKRGIIKGDEPDILKEFWEIAKDVDLFIGHNILDFDLKFIFKRSVIHKIKPTKEIPFARYRSSPVYDTMQEWRKWDTREKMISLDRLAKILGLPSSKGTLNGSKVYEFYKQGKLEEIYRYCMEDVELTRKIYNRLNFIS